MDKLKQFIARIDALSLRERAIVMAGILTLMFLGWYSYLMEPLLQEEKRIMSELDDKRTQLQSLNDQFVQMTGQRQQDPDQENSKKLANIRQQVAQVKQQVNSATANLVPPETMPDILRMVLNKTQGLTLLSLNGLGGTPLVLTKEADEATKAGAVAVQKDSDPATVFKHGMQIEIAGNYFETLNYMRALEDLEWGFFWDQVSFEVKDYPQAKTRITLYTISLSQNWIGI